MENKNLLLRDIWHPERLDDYKIHFARWNSEEQPLHVFARSMEQWEGWQQWYPGRNDFNRCYIFSLIQIPGSPDTWMFGGVWTVKDIVTTANGDKYYDVELSEQLAPLIGRLKLYRVHKGRGTRLKLEKHYDQFVVSEILAERYTGRSFPGYNSINLGFQELEALIKNDRQDWSTALGQIKGVYLITDTKTQMRYVGSAYGELGLWARWKIYASIGHGGNTGMRDLLKDHDLEYCRRYFKFALLEHHDSQVDNQIILDRESHWKQVLDTRDGEKGLNHN
ncbi:MAG: GIY-YIG nuclease family protein [Hyphomicrobiales bacterium]|nr:GIY-YIG nuclease family protein [Hyphomicrobiales bacterium]